MKTNMKHELLGGEGTVILDTIRRLNRRNAVDNILKLVKKTHPADIAWVFRHLTPEERQQLFNVIAQTEVVGEFLGELDQAIVLELVENLTPTFMVGVIKNMASDDAADLIELLPEEFANEIRQHMAKGDRRDVDDLLQYHPESAGGLMSPDFMALDEELSVGDAINKVQERSEEKEMSFYLYLVRGGGQLSGVVSLRELLMHPPYRVLKNIMNTKVLAVTTDTDQEEVAHIVSQYNILAVPVVDASNRLVGIVTVDDVIDVIRMEATEDFLLMAGAGKDDEILLKSTWQNAVTRAPWLFVSWIGGIISILVISHFQAELQKVLALAAFIPIVMGMGGNIATQSSSLVVRGMATGQVNMAELGKVILKQMRVGLLLGVLYGLLLGCVAYFRYAEPAQLGIVVGLSVFSSMFIAATFGTFVPLTMKRLGFDAAIATGPVVTTTIDIMGVITFFTIAQLILGL